MRMVMKTANGKRSIFWGILILIFIFSAMLTACASAGNGGAETPAGAESNGGNPVAVNKKGTVTVGFVMVGSESDWRLACNQSVRDAFSRKNGYYLVARDGQQKQENQMKAVREFIDMDVDYILLSPIAEKGWDAVLQEAKEADIPVIVFDRKVKVEDTASYVTWIGSDFLLEGRRACAWLEAYLETRGYEGELRIVHLQGTMESSAQIGRTKALDEALERNENWVLLDRQTAGFTTAKAKEVMADMLENYGDQIQVVYCENDNEAYGAIYAIEQAGRTVGANFERGDIMVLSFDAVRHALELAMTDDIVVVTECDPMYGPRLTHIVQQLRRGEVPEHEIYVDEKQFSAIWEPSEVIVNGIEHPVTRVTEELIEGRTY